MNLLPGALLPKAKQLNRLWGPQGSVRFVITERRRLWEWRDLLCRVRGQPPGSPASQALALPFPEDLLFSEYPGLKELLVLSCQC